MDYAVIEVGGKQYKVKKGAAFDIEGRSSGLNQELSFEKVLLSVSDGTILVGSPHVDGLVVKGRVVEKRKGKKVKGLKFRAKSRYRRAYGGRIDLLRVKIEEIGTVLSSKSDEGKTKSKRMGRGKRNATGA